MVLTLAMLLLVAHTTAQMCGNIQCSSDETCCKDFPGAIEETECCISLVTDCVKPRPPFTTSTCCPRWTVGCTAGSVGCCDPARPWQMLTTNARKPNRISGVASGLTANMSSEALSVPSAANATGYALFPASVASTLHAYTFDAATGAVTANHQVTGPFATYYQGYFGEGTRLLPFDSKAARFYLAEQWADPGAPVRSASSPPLVLFAIDPSSGASELVTVTGCDAGYPVGQAWDAASGMLIIGTQDSSTASFCAIDPAAGRGAKLGSVPRGASEASSDAFYAAYISHVAANVAVRVGHRLVTSGGEPGVVSVTLDPAGGAAKPSAFAAIDLGRHHGPPATVQAHPQAGFISLAPRVGMTQGYDVLGWDGQGGARILANLTNARAYGLMPASRQPSLHALHTASPHPTAIALPLAPRHTTHGTARLPFADPPREPVLKTPLGYVADTVEGSLYAALAVSYGLEEVGDKWAVSMLDVHSGALMQAALEPQPALLGAESTALSGFGIVAPTRGLA